MLAREEMLEVDRLGGARPAGRGCLCGGIGGGLLGDFGVCDIHRANVCSSRYSPSSAGLVGAENYTFYSSGGIYDYE